MLFHLHSHAPTPTDRVKKILSDALGDERVIERFRFDLNERDERRIGFGAVTEKALYLASVPALSPENEPVLRRFAVEELSGVQYTRFYGCVALEYRVGDDYCELCRASGKYSEGLMDAGDALYDLYHKKEPQSDTHCIKIAALIIV